MLPGSLTTIIANPFLSCESLSEIIIPDELDWITFKDGFLIANGTKLISYINPESTKAVVPKGVTKIGSYAFYDCNSLTEVQLPNTVTTIGEFAFWSCDSLTDVTLPDSLTTIEDFAFPVMTFFSPNNIIYHIPKGSYAETWAKETDKEYKLR